MNKSETKNLPFEKQSFLILSSALCFKFTSSRYFGIPPVIASTSNFSCSEIFFGQNLLQSESPNFLSVKVNDTLPIKPVLLSMFFSIQDDADPHTTKTHLLLSLSCISQNSLSCLKKLDLLSPSKKSRQIEVMFSLIVEACQLPIVTAPVIIPSKKRIKLLSNLLRKLIKSVRYFCSMLFWWQTYKRIILLKMLAKPLNQMTLSHMSLPLTTTRDAVFLSLRSSNCFNPAYLLIGGGNIKHEI